MHITSSRHPDYNETMLTKYRLVLKSGAEFLQAFLRKHTKEPTDAFLIRKQISYNPAFAKQAVYEFVHALHQRMREVTREGGSPTYLACCNGEDGGVDGEGSTMMNFMGQAVVPELLFLGRVGVYIDNVANVGRTRADQVGHPYVYIYAAEDILNWTKDPNRPERLTALLLRDNYADVDEETGLSTGTKVAYRLLQTTANGKVKLSMFDESGAALNIFNDTNVKELNIPDIPFAFGKLPESLLADVVDYQVALANLASSDLYYAWAANFPFYTEQFDPMHETLLRKNPETPDDFEPPPGFTEEELSGAEMVGIAPRITEQPRPDMAEIQLGPSTGRKYAKGLERPAFIHPSSEPLKASMLKEEQMKSEIRLLVYLTVANIQNKTASAESKSYDFQSLEGGLAFIGSTVEVIERTIAKAWHQYTNDAEVTKTTYPEQYDLQSDEDRRKDATELQTLQTAVPSRKFHKRIGKQIVRVLFGNTLPEKELAEIDAEIDASKVPSSSPETLQLDHEAGFVSTKTASEGRGYAPGEAEQAKKDHAERLARIQKAQESPASRGNPDGAVTPQKDAMDEKSISQKDTGGRGPAVQQDGEPSDE